MPQDPSLKLFFYLEIGHSPDDGIVAALRSCIAAGRRAPGNLAYRAFQDRNQRSRIVVLEHWSDRGAAEMHRQSPAFVTFTAALERFLGGPLGSFVQMVEVDELEAAAEHEEAAEPEEDA